VHLTPPVAEDTRYQAEQAATWWQATLTELEMQIERATFDGWLCASEARGWTAEGTVLVVQVSSVYVAERLAEQLAPLIRRVLRQVAGREGLDVRFSAAETRPDAVTQM